MGRPIVQRRGIEVRAIRPDDGVNFGINSNLIEKFQITQRAVKLAAQNRLEVDHLLGFIFKLQLQRVRADNSCALHEVDCVFTQAFVPTR